MTCTNSDSENSKNPQRVAAGKRNRKQQGPPTEYQRQRARETAQKHRPWEHSTGPRTPEGKAKSAANGRKRQIGEQSIRQLRAELADVTELIGAMRTLRSL